MWSWGRPKRDLPQINYNESSEEEENFQDGLNFDSPLQSPRRPLPTREGSPVTPVGGPTLADNVDEELEEVQWKLHDLASVREDIEEVTDLLKSTDTKVGSDIIKEEADETGFVVGYSEPSDCQVPPDPIMDFETENGQDDAGALVNALRNLEKLEFDVQDIDFYFSQAEIKMQTAGAKKQYTKFQILGSIIPKKVQDQVKSLLRKKETDFANNNSYKLLKDKIIQIFSPPQEARFERALSRTLTGLPSELARDLVNDICDHELENCCCQRTVVGLWKRALPMSVRLAVSAMKFTHETFDQVVQVADDAYNTSRPSGVTVAATTTSTWTSADGPSTQEVQNTGFIADPNDPVQVATQNILAAVQRGNFRGSRGGGRGRGGRGNRGSQRSRGGTSTASGQSSGGRWSHLQRHPDNPPSSVCKKHYLFGKSAHWCEEPASCPWKSYFVPKNK